MRWTDLMSENSWLGFVHDPDVEIPTWVIYWLLAIIMKQITTYENICNINHRNMSLEQLIGNSWSVYSQSEHHAMLHMSQHATVTTVAVFSTMLMPSTVLSGADNSALLSPCGEWQSFIPVTAHVTGWHAQPLEWHLNNGKQPVWIWNVCVCECLRVNSRGFSRFRGSHFSVFVPCHHL